MAEYLDTRDLATERDELRSRQDDHDDPDIPDDECDPLDKDERERLTMLDDLADTIGETTMRDGDAGPLIPDDDFEDYARELADDLGLISDDAEWPTRHIDWTAAADELRQDYSSLTFDGEDYLYRA